MFSPDGTLISASAAPHCGGRRTTEEIAKWNQLTALRFQTGGRHQTFRSGLPFLMGERVGVGASRYLVPHERMRGTEYSLVQYISLSNPLSIVSM